MADQIRVRTARALRYAMKGFVFRKRLPNEFGHAHVYSTPRADMRLLYPGFQRAAPDLMLVARHFVRPGSCTWDIGSNLGIFAACAAYKSGSDGKVFSLEPDPKYASLQSNTLDALGPSYASTMVLCAAVADRVGLRAFVVSQRGHARSHLSGVASDGGMHGEAIRQVIAVTLDFLLEEWHPPDLVKMDVEGAELLALSGAGRLLNEIRPTFYVEVAPENEHAVSSMLKAADYEIFKLEGDGTLARQDLCGMYTIARPKEIPAQ